MKSSTIKLLESINNSLNRENSNNYYHYDDSNYDINHIITNHYDFKYKEIVEIYNKIVGIDVSSVVYMLDKPDSSYEDGTYLYKYTVQPLDKVVIGNLDYSAIMCEHFLEDNSNFYNLNDKEVLKNIISTFARAYIGNEDDLELLSSSFTPFTGKKEYITLKCKIIDKEKIN